MTRDVLLTISGLQVDLDANEPVELITSADYFMKNDRHYILYNEIVPETGEEIKNTIKISAERIDVIKHGSQNVHMVFEPAKKNISCYNTPFGSMVIGLQTLNIQFSEEQQKIAAKIDYALEINEAHVSDCKLSLEIHPRQGQALHLQC